MAFTKVENPSMKFCIDCKHFRTYNSLKPGVDQTWYKENPSEDRCGRSSKRELVRGEYTYISCKEARNDVELCGVLARGFEPNTKVIPVNYPPSHTIHKDTEESWYEFWKKAK